MRAALPRAKADPVLRRFTSEVERLFPGEVEQVILFGSRARGEERPTSDYDIAIVLKHGQPPRHDARVDALVAELYDTYGTEINAWLVSRPDLAKRTLFGHNLRRDGLDLRRWAPARFPTIEGALEAYVQEIAANLISYARHSLKIAEANLGIHLPDVAGRESYMAVFNAAQAFIFARSGKSPKTHQGVNKEFNTVARGIADLSPEMIAFVGRAYEFKARADYHEGPPVTEAEAREAYETAARVVDIIERLLSVSN